MLNVAFLGIFVTQAGLAMTCNLPSWKNMTEFAWVAWRIRSKHFLERMYAYVGMRTRDFTSNATSCHSRKSRKEVRWSELLGTSSLFRRPPSFEALHIADFVSPGPWLLEYNKKTKANNYRPLFCSKAKVAGQNLDGLICILEAMRELNLEASVTPPLI